MGFAADLEKLVEKAKGNVEKATRMVVILAAQGLVMKSAVDTGRFRANWQFGAGNLNPATTDATDKGGMATLSRLQAEIGAAPIGGILWVSNSLPYAQRLEDGWSKQAPAGMVRLTVQELPGAVAAYVRGEL
ncbi:HK97 gp10 family phage protein [Xenophilus sp. Marseille-Q4582]|uniref:HK97 gp10 family phage protein n=1 Tax=Xenophilus sp. Marseille-Q4582 TaxID=2866600 RepID=UPI001CE47ADD|nr:HK97 gp10 family phage protein [Xenophilus sp. Marseille-Q4582]